MKEKQEWETALSSRVLSRFRSFNRLVRHRKQKRTTSARLGGDDPERNKSHCARRRHPGLFAHASEFLLIWNSLFEALANSWTSFRHIVRYQSVGEFCERIWGVLANSSSELLTIRTLSPTRRNGNLDNMLYRHTIVRKEDSKSVSSRSVRKLTRIWHDT